MARYSEGDSTQPEFQEGREERTLNWEESSLAKFNQFLGFSTEGLENDILSFLVKIRKMRERIHSKGLLEKSNFEMELKRLECSINYEGEGKQEEMSSPGQRGYVSGCPMNIKLLSWNVREANDSVKRKVIKSVVRKQKVDLFCIQETKIQVLANRVVRSLGPERYLDWKALDSCGSTGGVLVCWDKRSL